MYSEYVAQVFCFYDIPNTMLNSVRSVVQTRVREDTPTIILLCDAESIREEVKKLVKGKNTRVVFTTGEPTW